MFSPVLRIGRRSKSQDPTERRSFRTRRGTDAVGLVSAMHGHGASRLSLSASNLAVEDDNLEVRTYINEAFDALDDEDDPAREYLDQGENLRDRGWTRRRRRARRGNEREEVSLEMAEFSNST